MNEICEQIKTVLATPSRLSALAQLIAIHIANGTSSTKLLAQLTGYSDRAIRKAKAELECRNHNTEQAEPECRAEPGCRNQSAGRNPGAGTIVPPPRARAYKEPPTEVVYTKTELASSARARVNDIEGLNGSTNRLAETLAGWLAGPYGTPDMEAARSILVGNVEAYGADRVRAGMLELETLVASGEKPVNLAKTFSGFVKNARIPDPNKPQPERSFAKPETDYQRRMREMRDYFSAGEILDVEAING